MSTVCYDGPSDLIKTVEKDGYILIKNFFKRDAVEKVREELQVILDKDEARRIEMGGHGTDKECEFQSAYTPLMHTILFPCLQSPRYRDLANDMFDSAPIRDLMRGLAGDNFRMRLDLIRRSSGKNDYVDEFQLPHVWHRDTLGEFTFGIFFDDMPAHGGGGTAIIPRTHWDARDPRWDLMLGESKNMTRHHLLGNRPLRNLPDEYMKDATFNKRVARQANKNKVEISGQMGDVYLFLNDTWHGRAPNTTGKRFMISRLGSFATDVPFKDDIKLPAGMKTIGGRLGEHFQRDHIPNTQPDTLLRRVASKRKMSLMTKLAAREKDRILTQFYQDTAKAKEKQNI